MGILSKIITLCLLSSMAWAVNPRILTVSGTFFAGGSISSYLTAEAELVQAAKEFCSEFNEKVDRISNVNTQLSGSFELDSKNRTAADQPIPFAFSALVTCRP